MKEWASKNILEKQEFSKNDAVQWFATNYPKINSGTVAMHVEVMATNNSATRRHHKSVSENGYRDLFFKIGPNRFRLYDPSADPKPWYPGDVIETNVEDHDTDRKDEELLDYATEFAREKDLQNYLVKNLGAIEPGLRLYEDDEGLSGVEFDVGGRRVDILAIDSNGGFVVIELKVSKGYDRVVGQTMRYMAWTRDHIANGADVRGIIVASKITDDLKLAASYVPNIKLFEYVVNFEIFDTALSQNG